MSGKVDVVIRRSRVEDAAEMVAYMEALTNEPHNNMVLDPGQWTMTVAEEAEYLEKSLKEESGLVMLVAEMEGQIVGIVHIRRYMKPTERHAASFGVSVAKIFRGRGIGTKLIEAMLAWAREKGLRRIELKTFSRNEKAIALYERLGFVKEGYHKMALFKQGVWVDEWTMARILPE